MRVHAPTARLEGFLVQKMERGLAEVILGFRRDPLVGPTITVGLGGVLAESVAPAWLLVTAACATATAALISLTIPHSDKLDSVGDHYVR